MPAAAAVLSLLVEDNEVTRKYRKADLEKVGFAVIEAGTYNEAITAYRSAPALDLVVCDVNLDVNDQWNRGGIDVATEMRADNANLPIAGYSTILAEETWIEENPFSYVLPSNLSASERRAEFGKLLEVANEHRKTRLTRSQEKFDEYVRTGRSLSRYRPELLSRFVDPGLDKTGFVLKIVEPGEQRLSLSGEARTIAHPIPLWIQHGSDGMIAELYRFPLLFGSGSTEEEAIQSLFFLLDGFLVDLEGVSDPEHNSPMVQAMYNYLHRVLGSTSSSTPDAAS
jgi:CheY-like chemotaxis protein